jgi:hypothetical protein
VDSRSNPPYCLQQRIIVNGEVEAAKWWIVASLRIHPAEFNYTFNPLCYYPSRAACTASTLLLPQLIARHLKRRVNLGST